jgi:hypothetical protein
MSDQTQELLKLKNHIAKAKSQADQITGQIKQLEKQRAEEFGCATDGDAEAYIKELTTDVTWLEMEIEEGVKIAQEELRWGLS